MPLEEIIDQLFVAIEQLIPSYMTRPEDSKIQNGNVSVCIIDEDGNVYGKMFGAERPKMRFTYKIAWTKASQVWLTGIKTGEYEKMVFNGVFPENANGIEAPDLIGWEGGQPIILKDGTRLAVGFSGFRGVTDIEIIIRALAMIGQHS